MAERSERTRKKIKIILLFVLLHLLILCHKNRFPFFGFFRSFGRVFEQWERTYLGGDQREVSHFSIFLSSNFSVVTGIRSVYQSGHWHCLVSNFATLPYDRILDGHEMRHWNGRAHFFGAAAEAMRRILVEQARRKSSLRQGGGIQRQQLPEIACPHTPNADRVLDIDLALTQLAEKDREAAEVVKLHIFAGLTLEEVAHVLDAGTTEFQRPYFVMELVRGIPITEYCDKNKLPTQERLKLFATVCQAVQHAHTKGIIHRDPS